MIIRNEDPLNCETQISELMDRTVTPNELFYIRSHFAAPEIDGASWRLAIGGLVDRPLQFSLQDFQRLPAQVKTVTLECAGNGRAFLEPKVGGEQWALGAVSTAEWTGVPLAEILNRAGVSEAALGVVFKGAAGATDERPGAAGRFDRCLTLEEARESEVLLAYSMNGEPLPLDHGYPLRAIVSGWYGVASVKWLAEIEVVDRPLIGYFQTERYVFESEPVRHQRVRALITHPGAGDEVAGGALSVRGFAVPRRCSRVRSAQRMAGRGASGLPRHRWQMEATVEIDSPGPARIRARAMTGRPRAA